MKDFKILEILELETSIQPVKKLTAIHLADPKPASKFLNSSPSSPAYGTIYRITGSFLNATTSILKRVSVRNFKISQCFHRSKQNLEFRFSP
jgi:hypothetical protein